MAWLWDVGVNPHEMTVADVAAYVSFKQEQDDDQRALSQI